MEISIEIFKTMTMTSSHPTPITMDGKLLKEVDFIYFGPNMDKKGGSQRQISSPIAKSYAALKKNETLWKSKVISTKK